ncbi:hypothetical protein jhhlp_000397 [Lomentospora prolificans]|uniref:F-box domain-containing protein n=1 Tax=Lomentospora prolificans TaxID=41688 RepID=A0A2N3NKQ8_9PEZI|nr:hypothetical protein jhhlp_000397 [Lomentospora prolificans]
MDSFPTQQPDEGYSEDPLNPSLSAHNMAVPGLPSLADMPDWLARQLPGMPLPIKKKIAQAVLDALPTSAIAEIVEALNPRLYIDFVHYLPPEVCLKILEFLDPTSLINVARSCRTWHALALDKKLWRRLYHMEGWSVVPSEIQKWQERVNKVAATNREAAAQLESRPLNRKRAISEDHADCEMLDADRTQRHYEPGFLSTVLMSPSWSIATLPGSVTTPSDHATPDSGDIEMGNAARSKSVELLGNEQATSQPQGLKAPTSDDAKSARFLESLPPQHVDGLMPSTLWNWESRDDKYVINWKYLYSMRRRLESNWELGRFTNFQFPHPDYPEEGHKECIYSLQYTSEYLVSGSRDRTLRVWSMHTRRLVLPPLAAHSGSVLCLQFDADPEEDLIVSGSSDSDVILWRFSTGKLIQRLHKAHRESVLNVKFDKRILVTCSKDKTIKIFNRRPLRYGDVGYPQSEFVNPVPLKVKNYGYEPNLADELPVIAPYTMIGALQGHNAAVNAVQICGDEVVSASGDKAIKVWDWPKQKCTRTILGHLKGIACVQYDGRRVVSGSSDNEVKVFDSSTGLEVASLRAHTHLVRTVQAGFGDLPNSEEEDREAARLIDEEYFKALETGAVSQSVHTRSHSRRRGNAGSRRPEDITAYGANLPPGGGGGKYARIVSGSYDQSIIIWRRDKEGIWKDAHHLHQEKAAVAAQRQAPPMSRSTLLCGPQPTPPPTHHPTPTQTAHSQGPPSVPPFVPTTPPDSYQPMINAAVARGPSDLETALLAYPGMLLNLSQLQSAIDRVTSPYVRNQLRQTVHNAVERSRERSRAAASHFQQAPSASTSAGQPSTVAPTLPNLAPQQPSPTSHATAPSSSTTTPLAPAPPPSQTSTPSHGPGRQATTAQVSNAAATAAATHAAVSAAPHSNPQAPPHAAPHAAQHAATHGAVAAFAAHHHLHVGAAAHPPQPHHQHMADGTPARVFKLQFDARRIICCSQTSVIVGWDFCNGDAELEAVSRFFGPIE